MVSQAKVVKTPGKMLLVSAGSPSEADSFCKERAVSIVSTCKYTMQWPRQLRILINSTLPAKDLILKDRGNVLG